MKRVRWRNNQNTVRNYTCERCTRPVRLSWADFETREGRALWCDDCIDADGSPPSRASFRRDKQGTRGTRGCLVTVREQDTRELVTFSRPGQALQALRQCCSDLDTMPGDWLIVSYSTPNTIIRDLKGSRVATHQADDLQTPERLALGQIGRLDLIEPGRAVPPERGQMSNQRGRVRKPAA